MNKVFRISLLISALLVSLAVPAFASGEVDAGFGPVFSKTLAYSSQMGMTAQTDGKALIWGANFAVDGVAKGQIARLNTDGSVDNTFGYCGCLLDSISSIMLQPDGKLLVGGTGTNLLAKIVRLNTDGSQDGTFNSVFSGSSFQYSSAEVLAIQSDGKVLASAAGGLGMGYHAGYVSRLNSDGSTDDGFAKIYYDSGRLINGYLRSIALAPSNKVYVAVTTYSGPSSSSALKRYNSDGTVDSVWETATFAVSGSSLGTDIQTLALQGDESLLVGGRFDTVNGIANRDISRLLPAGNVDLTFTAPTLPAAVGYVTVLPGGKSLVKAGGKLFRLEANGSIDGTFVHPASITLVANKWTIDQLGRILFLGQSDQSVYRYYRLNPNGDIDASFAPNVTVFGQAEVLARQSDGKIIVAGSFTQVNGLARTSIARLNADGTTDPTFNAGTGFNVTPKALLVQPSGKILAAGSFSTYNGASRPAIARLNSDGSLDAAFAPVVASVNGISLQADGKILIFGGFTTVNSIAKARIARLDDNGVLDESFGVLIASGSVYSVIQQADLKYMVGGSFSGVDGFNRSNLVRLNANGSLDQSLNATGISTVNTILIQPDNKYLCLTGAGLPTSITRRLTDGTADAGFVPPTFATNSSSDLQLYSAVLQSDGGIIVGGNFNTVGGVTRNHLVRLNSSGALDQLFMQSGANAPIRAMLTQPDGKVVLGGDFTRVNDVTRAGVARIIPGQFTSVADFDYDGDGKADVSVFRPSENKWYVLRSSDFGVTQQVFAIAGDVPVPADYDGDGKTDMAIFRPSSGDWWSLSTLDGGQKFAHWGAAGDIPRPSDYTGDGRADYVVFRPSTNTWLRMSSSNGSSDNKGFGLAGDKPVTGDFDGDGKSDVAIYRPSDGNWWWQSSVDNIQRATRWGIDTDVPCPADFDGDGKTDFAVYRPATGVWYIINSSNGSFTIGPFGIAEDKPVPADYDGDGKSDIAVFRPSDRIWYLLRSTAGFTGFQFGISTDIPTENAFVP